jgi:hypothetical protein
LTISTDLRGFFEATAPNNETESAVQSPMSLQKQFSPARKTQGDAPEKRRATSLIGLAAILDDPICRCLRV